MNAVGEFEAELRCYEKTHDAYPSGVTISRSFLGRIEAEVGPVPAAHWEAPTIYGMPLHVRDDIEFGGE